MSTEIAIVLFVIGAGALILSVVVDRRPARPKRPVVLDVEAEAEATADLILEPGEPAGSPEAPPALRRGSDVPNAA